MSSIQTVNENAQETTFEQRHAVINFGEAPLSTYNLVNCIAIGGIFELPISKTGTFLTQDSPIDYLEHQTKLYSIKQMIIEKGATIKEIVIFHAKTPARDIYTNGLTTTDIINKMYEYCNQVFGVKIVKVPYECDISTRLASKAIISPSQYNTYLTKMVINKIANKTPAETFTPIILYVDDEKIYQCPMCKSVSGTYAPKIPVDTSLFSHYLNCPNKNRIPVE